jgi:hypothetical protein
MVPPTTAVERGSEQGALAEAAAPLADSQPIPQVFLHHHADRVHLVFPIYRPPRTA